MLSASRLSVFLSAILAFALAPVAEAAPMYQVVNLGIPQAAGITAAGQVVQSNAQGMMTVYNPYGSSAGQKQTLPIAWAHAVSPNGSIVGAAPLTPGSWNTYAVAGNVNQPTATPARQPLPWIPAAINDADQLATTLGVRRSATDNSTVSHAALVSGGTATDLGTLGGLNSTAYGINASGQVVGGAEVASGLDHAFLYSGGKMTDLGVQPGYDFSNALAVNSSGVVVGFSQSFPGARNSQVAGFIDQNGVMTDIGSLSTDSNNNTVARAINDLGVVVGSSYNGSSVSAFIWKDGVMTDLNTFIPASSDFHLAYALYINDAGQIVVEGEDARGVMSTYLLTPDDMPPAVAPVLSADEVPEPSTLVFAALVAGAAVARRARRRVTPAAVEPTAAE